jgi:hypothetical protein
MYEQSIQYTACLQITRTSDAQTLQEQLINLQRRAFYARYGDMLAEACWQLKKEAEIKKVEGWQTLQNDYWTEIDKKLAKKAPAYDQVLKGQKTHGERPTYMAISLSCMRVGFNMDDMLQIIHLYAVRNELVHANFIPLIKNRLFHFLAKRLYDDFCHIPLLIPDDEKMHTALVMRLLDTIIDLWFDRPQDDSDNYQSWIPTEELQGYSKSLRGPNPRDEVSLQREISASIVKGVRKRLHEAEQEKESYARYPRISGLFPTRRR